MKSDKLKEHMNEFYRIREDDVAKKYIELFIIGVTNDCVDTKDYKKWARLNDKKLFKGLKPNSKMSYRRVLNLFIKYISTVDEITKTKKTKYKKSKEIAYNKPKTKIYSTFNDMVKFNS